MELLQLRYFISAAESENFSKTAKDHLVPTSNISQSIKRLEKELGNPLFTRTANKVALNDHGREFYKEIKKAINIMDNAKSKISNNDTGGMKIGIFINRRIAMTAVEKFQKLYPNISIIISHEWNPLNTDFDLVVSDGERTFPELERSKLFEEKLVLAAPKDYFISGKITVDDIKTKPFITMSSGWSLYNMTKKICNDMGFEPRIALQSDDPFYIRKCIELGLGISIVSEFSWRGQFSSDINLINIGDYKRDIFVHRRKEAFSPWYLNEFYTILLSCYKKESPL